MHGPFHHVTQNEKDMCPVCAKQKSIGGVMSTTIRLYVGHGAGGVVEIPIESAEAVLRLLNNPCVRKLRDGEPFFLLRGQDSTAPAIVEKWRAMNFVNVAQDKYDEAGQIAQDMRVWPHRRVAT